MAEPLKIDSHLHIYRSKEEGRRQKAGGYVIWEYGEKSDVHFSQYGGDLEDALDAIEKSAFDKAVVVNLFSQSRDSEYELSGLPEGVLDSDRGRAEGNINSSLGDRLQTFNTWLCELVEPYSQLIPFIAADPSAMPGEEGAAHIRDMVENHGARGIKLHPVLQQFDMGDRRMWPVYRTCQELAIPIVAHSGPARDREPYAEPHAFVDPTKTIPPVTRVAI